MGFALIITSVKGIHCVSGGVGYINEGDGPGVWRNVTCTLIFIFIQNITQPQSVNVDWCYIQTNICCMCFTTGNILETTAKEYNFTFTLVPHFTSKKAWNVWVPDIGTAVLYRLANYSLVLMYS